MTEVLFTMYTCSMAMVGVSLIMMRRSELATCDARAAEPVGPRANWRGCGGALLRSRFPTRCPASRQVGVQLSREKQQDAGSGCSTAAQASVLPAEPMLSTPCCAAQPALHCVTCLAGVWCTGR